MNTTTDASHAVAASRWLIKLTGSKLAPAGYVAACVVVSLIAVSMLRETANKPID